MRIVGIFAALCLVAPAVAYADLTAPELQARGEALAKEGRFTDAIDAFKAADRIEPRASHACLIALAYTRRELWPQAEIFLDKCHQRATPADPLPEWVNEADTQIKTRLAAANVASIEIVVEPADASVELTVSSFPPDESFAPRTIHLPPGHHVILAKAKGYQDTQHAIDVADKTPQHVAITLARPGAAPPSSGEPSGAGFFARMPTLAKYGLIAAGLGVATYGAMSYYWWQMHTAPDNGAYNTNEDSFKPFKYATIGLWSVAAALIVVGYYTRGPEQPAVAIVPTNDGGMVSVGWQR